MHNDNTRRIAIILLLALTTVVFGRAQSRPSKLSLLLQMEIQKPSLRRAMSRTANPVKTLYVKLGDNMTESIFAKYNAKIMSCISGIYIVKTSLENAERLAEEEGVERIETPLPLFPSNDVTRSAVNANAAQDNPLPPLTQAFTGKGVLAGIVDGGFYFRHPTFQNGDGSCAVEFFRESWGYGYEDYTSPADVFRHGHSNNNGLHGTHVMGTIAGRGVNGLYRGIAPDAEIVASDDMDDLPGIFTWMSDYAQEHDKPMVVNISAGSIIPFGFEGAFSLERQIIDSLTERPGFIIVAAAGNYGMDRMYSRKESSGIKKDTLTTMSSNMIFGIRTDEEVATEMVIARNGQSDTITLKSDSIYTTINKRLDHTGCDFTASKEDSEGNTACFVISSSDATSVAELPVVYITNDGGHCEMNTFRGTSFVSNGNQANCEGTLTYPAMYKGVIAVGATQHTTEWENYKGERINYGFYDGYEVAPWSSYGIKADGLVKPEVVAPGTNIVSALDYKYRSDAVRDGKSLIIELHKDAPQPYGWTCSTGTSMAAPVVTGTVALWLQADPTLTSDRIRGILERTSSKTGSQEDANGYGEINAYRGLLDILGLSGTDNISANPLSSDRIKVSGRSIYVETKNPATLSVYNSGGTCIRIYHLQQGKEHIDMPDVTPGIYIIQLNSVDPSESGSQIIRL